MRVPSRPSFSTAPRKGLPTLATLEKPLCREFLFYPVQSLSRSVGSGLCVAREPRLPRTHGRASRARPFVPVSRLVPLVSRECVTGWCYSWGTLMRTLRSRLSVLAIVFQLAGVLAPVVLPAAVAEASAVCTCPGGTHATTCPMHHGNDTGSPADSNRCAIRSASVPTDLALLTLGTGAGVLPSLNGFDVNDEPSAILTIAVASIRARADFPDSPPPRG
jgi:hypothetical protein